MEISKTKEAFLKHVGIDLENLPEEFKKTAKSYGANFTKEEKEFLFSDSYTKAFVLNFRMKDIVGTSHPSYEGLTFLEAFIKSRRGDEIVNMFYNNPGYYSNTLKQPDQSFKTAGHDSPIELNRDGEGNCYINGGNNRLNLLMMTYLKELSDAKTEEEKIMVNNKYTFYAEVRSLPKNKDVNNTIFILKDIYEDNIKFFFVGENPDDCHYLITLNDQQIEITDVTELKKLLYQAYSLEGLNALELYNKLVILVTNYISIKAQGNENKIKLLTEMCPNIEEIKDLFLNLRSLTISNAVFEGIDLTNVNYLNLTKHLNYITNKVQDETVEFIDVAPSNLKM